MKAHLSKKEMDRWLSGVLLVAVMGFFLGEQTAIAQYHPDAYGTGAGISVGSSGGTTNIVPMWDANDDLTDTDLYCNATDNWCAIGNAARYDTNTVLHVEDTGSTTDHIVVVDSTVATALGSYSGVPAGVVGTLSAHGLNIMTSGSTRIGITTSGVSTFSNAADFDSEVSLTGSPASTATSDALLQIDPSACDANELLFWVDGSAADVSVDCEGNMIAGGGVQIGTAGTLISKVVGGNLADGSSGWTPDGAATSFTITASATHIIDSSFIGVSVGANATLTTCSVSTRTASTSFVVKCSAAPADAATLQYQIMNF